MFGIPSASRVPRSKTTGKPAVEARRYSSAVMGDGRVLPIVETIGRRVIREVDPMSPEGRSLLHAGRVTLWYDDGARAETAPIQQVLDRLRASLLTRRDAYGRLPGWTEHYDDMLKRIGRVKRSLKPRH